MAAAVISMTFCQLRALSRAPVTLRSTCSASPALLQATSHSSQLLTTRHAATKAEVEENLNKYKDGKYEKHLPHFRKPEEQAAKKDGSVTPGSAPPIGTHALPHPIWTDHELHSVSVTHKPPEGFIDKAAFFTVKTMRGTFDLISGFNWGSRTEKKWLKADNELHSVEITHKPPEGIIDRAAFFTVKTMRGTFDLISGFNWGSRTEKKWLKRIIFLETVAGVPGMVAAMTRHLHSLRRMQRDYGWIHTLLEEAENERMHLMTALQLKQPSVLFRLGVVGTQGIFVTMFSLWYLVSPRFCHRFVGYLEEEAVKTYTKCLLDIEQGNMQHWKTQSAPAVAVRYWNLPADATMKDVILAIRADEAHHRLVNHTLASMKETDYNPYKPGK